MILNPAIIALMAGSCLVAAFALYAAGIGVRIIRSWDLASGSEGQLTLERKTYLISSIMSYLLVFEMVTLFMFVTTADQLRVQFVGAMCAAGSLNVNAYGYPTLVVKIVNFIACGIWLILNHFDNRGHDYPLIRPKYKLLMAIAAALLLEAYFQAVYFLTIRPNVITSCCGTLFSEGAESVAGGIAALPPYPTLVVFFLSVVLTLRVGVYFYVTGKAPRLYALLCGWLLVFSIMAIISVISVYFYELPTHHCPFCILQKEYYFIGYPIYLLLFIGGISGVSVGIIARFRKVESLKQEIPGLQKRLCVTSMIGFGVFALIATAPMIFSDFRLFGY